MPDQLAYTGPGVAVLRNGRHVAPGTPIDLDELEKADAETGVTAERDFYDDQGWLTAIEDVELSGDALKARAAELNVEGRSKMGADELREAVEQAETEHAAQTNDGGES